MVHSEAIAVQLNPVRFNSNFFANYPELAKLEINLDGESCVKAVQLGFFETNHVVEYMTG